MEVICIEEGAFFKLLEEVLIFLGNKCEKEKEKWVSGEEAMKMLHIKSKTTLQKFRDEGVIRFSQPEKKIILYDVESILKYLEKHAKETF